MSIGESNLGTCIVGEAFIRLGIELTILLGCAGNTTCYIECDHQFKDEIKECPCNENCATGCPCDGYVCTDDEVSTSAVLILSSFYNKSVPVLVDFRGRVDQDMQFSQDF